MLSGLIATQRESASVTTRAGTLTDKVIAMNGEPDLAKAMYPARTFLHRRVLVHLRNWALK